MTEQINHLREIFTSRSDQIYLLSAHRDYSLTYGDVLTKSLRFATWLQSQGIKEGDRIVFVTHNSIDLAILYYAVWHCGAQVVPINHQLAAAHLIEIITDANPTLIFADTQTIEQLTNCASPYLSDKIFTYQRYEDREKKENFVLPRKFIDLEKIYNNVSLDSVFPRPFGEHNDDYQAFLRVYTSGTTKKPKGIDISYAGLVGNERVFCDVLGINEFNRFYNLLPMSYLGGIHNLLLLPASVGGSVVIDEPLGGANLYGFWDIIRTKDVNTLWFTSTMLAMLLSLRDDMDLGWLKTQIKIGLVGMAPLSARLKKDFEERFGFTLYENYAMSETAFISTNKPNLKYRVGSSGRLLPGVEVDIFDMEGNPLPNEKEGQVFVRTPYMMLGYINAPEEDMKNVKLDGMFTGDLGYLSQGELFISGRVKDLIIRGGLNISPAQIESVLAQLDEVSEVAVIGVPHPVYGEEVAAAVTLQTWATDVTEKELLDKLKSRIAYFQKPKKILILEKMPRGITGKIDKKKIAALMLQDSFSHAS